MRRIVTPQALANFSPALERSDYAGTVRNSLIYTEGVGQRLWRIESRVAVESQGMNPGLELANTFGVIGLLCEPGLE